MQNRYTPRFNLFKPVKILLAILLVGLVFFTPVVNKTDETPSKLQSVFPELKPFASSADACPWACIECTSWDPDAWPRGCATYECNAACEAGDPSGGGGGPVYQPPTISHVLTCSNPGNNGWCIGSLSLDLSASDPQGQSVIISGDVNGTTFACPSGQTTCSVPIPEGTGTLNYKVDAATGLSASGSASYQVDVTTPQISGSLAGTAGQNGWYVSPTLVTASPSDTLSGIASFEVNVDNAGYTTYADTTFTDGVHTIQYRAYDNAGNYTEVSQTVMVDTIAPSLSAPGGLHLTEMMNYRLDDATSGLAQFSAFIADKDHFQGDAGGAWAVNGNSYSGTFFWDGSFANDGARVGYYSYTLTVTDLAGNQASMMGAYEVQYRNLVYLGLVPNKNNKPDTPPLQVYNPSGAALYQAAPTEAPTEVPSEAILIPTEEPIPAAPAPTLEVRSNVFEGTSVKSAFTAGNQTTTTPISNANILWGGAATALLGATLAEWQRKRAEEEAARLAALRNSGGGDEGGDGGGRTNAGRKAYQAMMQEKRIVGALQAEQNAKAAQTQAASQRAKDDFRAGEKAYDIAQASTQNNVSGKPLAMPVPMENRVTDKEREEAMTAYREGERNAVSIAEEYKSQVREEANKSYHEGERWADIAPIALKQAKPWWQRVSESVYAFTQTEVDKFQTWNSIRNKYGWTPIGIFSQQELNTIAETGKDITNYVDKLSPGNGQAWVKSYIPANIIHWPLSLTFLGEKFERLEVFTRPMGLPGTVILPYSWEKNYSNPKSMPLIHEFGHVWDANTGRLSLQGIVGGVADQLNNFIGGTVVEQNGSRFLDKSGKSYITDADYLYGNDNNSNYKYKTYAQNSTADYLCESFNALIYSTQAFPKPEVGQWIEIVIKLQADNLGKAANSKSTAVAPIPAPTAPPTTTPIPSQTPEVGGRQ